MFAATIKIFVILLALSCNVYSYIDDIPPKGAKQMFGGFANFEGYKNIKFGMDTNTVHSLISSAANTTSTEISAELIDTLILTENSEALKYYDAQYKLVYIFFFEQSQLYRIDIASYSGGYLDNLEIENPVSMSTIENIITSINVEYGRFTKHEIQEKGYKGFPFTRNTYWWLSNLGSISLLVNQSISTVDKEYKHYMYRLTYYSDRLVRELRSNK